MIKQYVNIGYHRLVNFKVYSLINIIGFGIAMAVCLSLLLFSSYHFGFDRFISESENCYRLVSRYGDGTYNANTFASFDDVISNNSDIASYTTVYNNNYIDEIYVDNNKVTCDDVIFANESFLDYFSIQMNAGEKQSIGEPNTMFVTPKMASKLFPDDEAIGKTVFVRSFTRNRDSLIDYTIKGIIEPLPNNSHLTYDILLSQNGHFSNTIETVKARKVFAGLIYIRVFPEVNAGELENTLSEGIATLIKGFNGPPADAFNHKLQPIRDIHFTYDMINETGESIRLSSLYILLLVGLLIFAIATINFVNIHIARSTFHSNQSRIIISLGGSKLHLFSYLLTEILISVTISFVLAIIGLIAFNHQLIEYFNLKWQISSQISEFLIVTSGSYIIVMLIASVFCSTVFTVRPGLFKFKKSAVPLLIFQFVLVVVLIGFTILVNKQMNYVAGKDLGYSNDNVLIIEIPQRNSKIITFTNELLKLHGIVSVGTAQHYPGYKLQDMNFSNGDYSFPFKFGFIDQNILSTLDINILQFFKESGEVATDGWYINETFYNKLKQTYTAEQITTSNFPSNENNESNNSLDKFELLGVISDFHYASLHSEIENFAFFIPKPETRYNRFVIARINQTQNPDVLSNVENMMHEIYPDERFNYSFLDTQINTKYQSEQTLLKLINSFSILAIIVACLGLIGFTLFITKKRTKEIGIRKVNGASVFEIVILLNGYFVKWILLALVLATPIAYFIMKRWLENFAYKTEISWWIFVLSGFVILVISIGTVCSQTIWAARRNPVESLRYE
jgi:putative ABC transport system permease protein